MCLPHQEHTTAAAAHMKPNVVASHVPGTRYIQQQVWYVSRLSHRRAIDLIDTLYVQQPHAPREIPTRPQHTTHTSSPHLPLPTHPRKSGPNRLRTAYQNKPQRYQHQYRSVLCTLLYTRNFPSAVPTASQVDQLMKVVFCRDLYFPTPTPTSFSFFVTNTGTYVFHITHMFTHDILAFLEPDNIKGQLNRPVLLLYITLPV